VIFVREWLPTERPDGANGTLTPGFGVVAPDARRRSEGPFRVAATEAVSVDTVSVDAFDIVVSLQYQPI